MRYGTGALWHLWDWSILQISCLANMVFTVPQNSTSYFADYKLFMFLQILICYLRFWTILFSRWRHSILVMRSLVRFNIIISIVIMRRRQKMRIGFWYQRASQIECDETLCTELFFYLHNTLTCTIDSPIYVIITDVCRNNFARTSS